METEWRMESDSMGEIRVPADKYWGAQTQRSLQHFNIGGDRIPKEVIHAFAVLKKACAQANRELGRLNGDVEKAICRVCDEISSGKHEEQFPLKVWMTGSGTQSNMNVNEVIANRASCLLGGTPGNGRVVHPNDHVNNFFQFFLFFLIFSQKKRFLLIFYSFFNINLWSFLFNIC